MAPPWSSKRGLSPFASKSTSSPYTEVAGGKSAPSGGASQSAVEASSQVASTMPKVVVERPAVALTFPAPKRQRSVLTLRKPVPRSVSCVPPPSAVESGSTASTSGRACHA